MKTRYEQRRDRMTGILQAVALVLLLVLLALILLGNSPEPEREGGVTQGRARFAAQERYYDVLERYGDLEGATQAAQLAYETVMDGDR